MWQCQKLSFLLDKREIFIQDNEIFLRTISTSTVNPNENERFCDKTAILGILVRNFVGPAAFSNTKEVLCSKFY